MIGIFDSGIGGLSVFREIYKLLPRQRYAYYADSAHCPYGGKSREYVENRARSITDFLLEKGADIIVVACNTATAAAIATLRNEYSDPKNEEVRQKVLRLTSGRRDHIKFIGMEPAVKPASEHTETGVIGVLATAGTLSGNKYKTTRETFAKGVTVVEHVGEGFVELVEKGLTSGPEAESTVSNSVMPLLKSGADTIVLGCTHYPFLSETISKIAGPDIKIIDPAPAVARHLVEIMNEEGIQENEIQITQMPDVSLYTSGNLQSLETAFSRLSII